MLTKEMLSYIAENIEDIKRIIRDLCAIPAPSHHEEKRAGILQSVVPGQRL